MVLKIRPDRAIQTACSNFSSCKQCPITGKQFIMEQVAMIFNINIFNLQRIRIQSLIRNPLDTQKEALIHKQHS